MRLPLLFVAMFSLTSLAQAAGENPTPLRFLSEPLFTNPNAVLAVLLLAVAGTIGLCGTKFYKSLPVIKVIPAVFLIYFVPMVLNTVGLFDSAGTKVVYDNLKVMALPMSLVLLLVGTDLPLVLKLGPKVIAVMIAASVGVFIGGVVAFAATQGLIDDPDLWKGVGALAGSWIGGSANMIAAKEALGCPQSVFTPMTVIDVVCGYGWMVIVMALAGIQVSYDKWNKADTKALEEINTHIGEMHAGKEKPIKTVTLMTMLAVAAVAAHGAMTIGHWMQDDLINMSGSDRRAALEQMAEPADWPQVESRIASLIGEDIEPLSNATPEERVAILGAVDSANDDAGTIALRVILRERGADPDQVELPLYFLKDFLNYLAIGLILASLFGLALSFTPLRKLEFHGASEVGYTLLFMVLAALGSRADLNSLWGNGWYLLLGSIWIAVFVVILFLISKIFRAPLFLVATASQANIGGAVSAPVVAGAYQPNLAVIGVLMAVIGQVIGTFLAIGTGWACSVIAITP